MKEGRLEYTHLGKSIFRNERKPDAGQDSRQSFISSPLAHFSACISENDEVLKALPHSHPLKSIGFGERGQYSGDCGGGLRDVRAAINDLYYEAKNTSFNATNYYAELKEIERMRALIRSTYLLGLLLSVASSTALLAVVFRRSLLDGARKYVSQYRRLMIGIVFLIVAPLVLGWLAVIFVPLFILMLLLVVVCLVGFFWYAGSIDAAQLGRSWLRQTSLLACCSIAVTWCLNVAYESVSDEYHKRVFGYMRDAPIKANEALPATWALLKGDERPPCER